MRAARIEGGDPVQGVGGVVGVGAISTPLYRPATYLPPTRVPTDISGREQHNYLISLSLDVLEKAYVSIKIIALQRQVQ